jgi:hypothetical protein
MLGAASAIKPNQTCRRGVLFFNHMRVATNRVQSVQHLREQNSTRAVHAIETGKIDINRQAAVEARLGDRYRPRDLGRMSQVEDTPGDEVCLLPISIGLERGGHLVSLDCL